MNLRHLAYFVMLVALLCLPAVVGACSTSASAPPVPSTPRPPALPTSTLVPQPSTTPHVATQDELRAAQSQWALSGHADTFDGGLGANTTCAHCKSPLNFELDALARLAAEDCSACKRLPGEPRPDLSGGVPVAQSDWKNINCPVCHQPVGNSYSTALSFWNPEHRAYESVKSSTELCAKCHAEQHGFGVIWEQSVSPAHKGWECTRCHGSHNARVQCIDCHNPNTGNGATAHQQHSTVDCTACHDAMKSVIWQDPSPDSRFYGLYFPQRTAHGLRSWPSHNIQTQVDCLYCHHPQGTQEKTLASDVKCSMCHTEGATFNWCPAFSRNSAPRVSPP